MAPAPLQPFGFDLSGIEAPGGPVVPAGPARAVGESGLGAARAAQVETVPLSGSATP
jgi:hypothetical protein